MPPCSLESRCEAGRSRVRHLQIVAWHVRSRGFCGVDVLGAGVVTTAGIALGVFVRQDRSGGFEYGSTGVVLGRDKNDLFAESSFLGCDYFGDYGVFVFQVQCVGSQVVADGRFESICAVGCSDESIS